MSLSKAMMSDDEKLADLVRDWNTSPLGPCRKSIAKIENCQVRGGFPHSRIRWGGKGAVDRRTGF